MTPDRMVLSIVGDVNTQAVLEKLKILLSARTPRASRAQPAAPRADMPPQSPRSVFYRRNRNQTHLVLGFMGTTLSGKDRHPLEVLMATLAGQSGRLFVQLRDRQSLAYAVSGFSLEGIEPGYVALYLAVDPSKSEQAVQSLMAEVNRLSLEPMSLDELTRVQNFLIGNQAVSQQRAAARAATMALNELYGLGHLAHLEYPRQISAVTRADVMRVARKYLVPQNHCLAVVGPQPLSPATGTL